MTRGEFLGGCLVALLITCSPGLAGVVVTALTGPDRLDAPSTSSVRSQGEGDRAEEHSPWVAPRAARASRSVRRAGLPTGALSALWASTAKARAVAFCESSGDIHAVSATGKHRGKWQADADFWRTYGGLVYAPRPELASEVEQDAVAYRGWLARGWQPWACA